MPELEPVPRDHVVTKTFYLIDGFVGRTDMGQTWIEALPPPDPSDRAPRPARAGDSVSPIIVTSNDLAGAWAVDDERRAAASARSPAAPRQREMALRGGVNLVMYALTGNYKADQVHAQGPAGKAVALNAWSLAFSPLWPLPLLAALAALALVVVGLTLWRRPRAALWRALGVGAAAARACSIPRCSARTAGR